MRVKVTVMFLRSTALWVLAVLLGSGMADPVHAQEALSAEQRRDQAIQTIVRGCADEVATNVRQGVWENPKYTQAHVVELVLGRIAWQYDDPQSAVYGTVQRDLGNPSTWQGSAAASAVIRAMLRLCVEHQRSVLEANPNHRLEPGRLRVVRAHDGVPGAVAASPDSERLSRCIEIDLAQPWAPRLVNKCDEPIAINFCILEFECDRFVHVSPRRHMLWNTTVETVRRGLSNTVIYWACPAGQRALLNRRANEFGCRSGG